MEKTSKTQFQNDLIKHRYHIYDPEKVKKIDFYPKKLVQLIKSSSHFNKKFKIEIGETYAVRAFFAISEPIDNEVQYQSGYLDLKLLMQDNELFIAEVVTELPPMFFLKKGSKIKIKKKNIIYKPDY